MNTILNSKQIVVEWAIKKNPGADAEHFERAVVGVFLIGPEDIYAPESVEIGKGMLSVVIPDNLPVGIYDLKAVWVKNGGNLRVEGLPRAPKRQHGVDNWKLDNRCVMCSYVDGAFALTDISSEETRGAGDAPVLNMESYVASYGYDGLSAYEIARMRGLTLLSEKDWVKNYSGEIIDTDQIAPGAVTEEKIRKRAVTADKLAEDIVDGEDVHLNSDNQIQLKDKDYDPENYSGLGRVYVRKQVAPIGRYFDLIYPGAVTVESSSLTARPDGIVFVTASNEFMAMKGGKYYRNWTYGRAEDYKNPGSFAGVFVDARNYKAYYYTINGLVGAAEGSYETGNVLLQRMMNKENTIYHIQYDHDLCGDYIEVPEGCVLEFEGGSLKDGTIAGNGIVIKGDTCCLRQSLSVRGQYNGFLKASWIGLGTQDSTEILRSLDTLLIDKKQLSLDVDVKVNEGGIILPKDIIIDGCNHKIINTCTNDYSYMFALSNNATLKDVEFRCSNTNYEGIILLWSTDTFKEASPEKCMLSNVQIVCTWRADYQYKATGLCIKATASGTHHNYISNCNVYNLQIKNVKDGLVLINDNTDGTSSDFAWSNNICFDYLYVSSNNRAVTLQEINPNNVGNSIGPYIIGNLMAQAINSEGSSPIVYYISADIADTKLLVNSDESWDYHDAVGELHGGNLSVGTTLLYRYSYDLNQTDEKGTYDYIGRIKKYTGSTLSLGSYPGHIRSIIKPNYNNTTGDNVNQFQAVKNGWNLVDGTPWNKSGNIEYRRGNTTDGDRNGVFTFYRHLTNPNTTSTKLITTPNGIVMLYYDPALGGFKPICKNVIWKSFTSSETNISSIQLHQYTPFVFCRLELNSLSTDSFYRVIIRVKNSSLGTGKALKSVFGSDCVVLNKYTNSNTQTLDSYSSFMAYIKPERSSCDVVFLLYYDERLYKSDSWMLTADLDYYTTDITATAIQRSFNQVSSNSDTVDYITASNIFPEGFGLYEKSRQKPIWWNGTAWVDATGATV